MDGVYYPRERQGKRGKVSHALERDHAGELVTVCQKYPVFDMSLIDQAAGESAVECTRCLGELAKRRPLAAMRPAVVPEQTAAEAPIVAVAGGYRFTGREPHLSHDQVVSLGLLRLLNTQGRSLLPAGCFFTSEADTLRDGQAVLRIVNAMDDPALLARVLKIIEATPR